MPTVITLRATGAGASCRATPATKTAEVGLGRQQHWPASDCTAYALPALCSPPLSSAPLHLPATFKTCIMPFQARHATYALKRSVTRLILHFWMAKIRQESATPFYFFKALNTFYSALMQNMPAATACNQSKSARHHDFAERSSVWAKEESDSAQLRDDSREVLGLCHHRALQPLWGLALAHCSSSSTEQGCTGT